MIASLSSLGSRGASRAVSFSVTASRRPWISACSSANPGSSAARSAAACSSAVSVSYSSGALDVGQHRRIAHLSFEFGVLSTHRFGGFEHQSS